MFKYLNLSRLLQRIVQQGQQLKQALYESKTLKPSDIPASYSLLSLVLNNYSQISTCQQEICERSRLQVSNPYLVIVMVGEYINKGKIIGGGKLKKAIMQNLDLIPQINRASKINKQKVQVRLRQNSVDFAKMKAVLTSKGQEQKDIPNLYNLNYQAYSELTKVQGVELLKSTACVVQSYSSCLPPLLLLQNVKEKWPRKRYDVIDACSAPGNKTIQLAEYLGHNGTVFAFEKNPKRFSLLQKTVKKYEVDNVRTSNEDFLNIQPGGQYKRVKFVMLDPSCSGSGMLTNFSRDGEAESEEKAPIQSQTFQSFCEKRYEQLSLEEKQRVDKLHSFQIELLDHAAKFKPARLSYSTCSIHKRENEDVVAAFLSKHREYRLRRSASRHKDSHPGFGGEQFKHCIRMDPRPMRTDGFFVAVFTKAVIEP